MNSAVIDSSVFLAIVFGEPMSRSAVSALLGSTMSTINLAEVHTKLALKGVPWTSELDHLLNMLAHIVPLTAEQARIAGELAPKTKSCGLSLGDRACIATAMDRGAEIYTMESKWLEFDFGVPIHHLR